MTNPVMVVHKQSMYGTNEPLGRGCWVWCPGCDIAHMMNIVGEDGSKRDPIWQWDGNVERPTFSPSIMVKHQGTCHSHIRDGRWEFLGDCTHSLAGRTVDMVPVPDWLCRPPYNGRSRLKTRKLTDSGDEPVSWD